MDLKNYHLEKSFDIRSFFRQSKQGKIQTRKNSAFEHLSRNACIAKIRQISYIFKLSITYKSLKVFQFNKNGHKFLIDTCVALDSLSLCERCPYSEFFWSVFSRIRTECGEIRENTDQKNSDYGHFLHSV